MQPNFFFEFISSFHFTMFFHVVLDVFPCFPMFPHVFPQSTVREKDHDLVVVFQAVEKVMTWRTTCCPNVIVDNNVVVRVAGSDLFNAACSG